MFTFFAFMAQDTTPLSADNSSLLEKLNDYPNRLQMAFKGGTSSNKL